MHAPLFRQRFSIILFTRWAYADFYYYVGRCLYELIYAATMNSNRVVKRENTSLCKAPN